LIGVENGTPATVPRRPLLRSKPWATPRLTCVSIEIAAAVEYSRGWQYAGAYNEGLLAPNPYALASDGVLAICAVPWPVMVPKL
jgi:hypothetical protein